MPVSSISRAWKTFPTPHTTGTPENASKKPRQALLFFHHLLSSMRHQFNITLFTSFFINKDGVLCIVGRAVLPVGYYGDSVIVPRPQHLLENCSSQPATPLPTEQPVFPRRSPRLQGVPSPVYYPKPHRSSREKATTHSLDVKPSPPSPDGTLQPTNVERSVEAFPHCC